MRQLPAGTFFGRTVRTWQTSALALSESVYEPHTVLAAHAHARPYLCLVLQGAHDETSGSHVRQCTPATVVVHPAGERHANRFAVTGGRLFRLEWDESWLARCGGFADAAQFDGGPLSMLANRIFREFRGPDDLSPLMIEALAMEFAATTTRSVSRDAHRGEPAWMRRVIEYLHAHSSESIRLETLAREAGVHAAHLNRAFGARHGCSIGEYVRRLRVEAATRLLVSSTMSIAEIAIATGFADQSHFSRVFARVTGTSPGRYRANITSSA